MNRRTDGGREQLHYRVVRWVKLVLGLVAGAGAVAVAVLSPAAPRSALVIGTLAVLSGLMIDAPGTTTLVSKVVDGLPWTPSEAKRPPEDG